MHKTTFFEDFTVGQVIELGAVEVTDAMITDFATEFDPRPVYLDPAVGSEAGLGGIVASGWHVCALAMRLVCDGLLSHAASGGSPGIERVSWIRPVRPGDHLTATMEATSVRALRSRPDLGIVGFTLTLTNGHGQPVMEWDAPILFERRAAAA